MKNSEILKRSMCVIALAAAVAVVSCSTYSVSKEMSSGSALKKIKNACIVLRMSQKSKISREEQTSNLSNWIAAARPLKKTAIAPACGEGICSYGGEEERFFQVDGEGNFLKFKATGVVNEFVRANGAELKKILAENDCDGLIIYEVYGVMALEMQFFDFDSVVCVLDRDLRTVYLDHQFDSFDVEEISATRLRQQLLDRVSERLIHTLDDLNFLRR
ncbi:MAG TPA: hypothetical protein VLM75_06745 [Spirochaetota bacterium]|nr:hypothetical protein [Spirochaetota bacterium]